MREVKDKYTRVHLLSAFLHAKDPIDKRERSELPQELCVICLWLAAFVAATAAASGCCGSLPSSMGVVERERS